jgi:hypothetical protein
MKKIFLLILGFVMFKVGYSQYPIQQFIGADSAVVTSKGGMQGRFINVVFPDTTTANSQRIRQYAGAMIYAAGKLWVRNTTATGWNELAYNITPVNIYNSNGSLTSNRTLDGDGYSLTFDQIGGEFGVGADSINFAPASGKFRISSLNQGIGTKALRYNPVTKLITYSDTTSSVNIYNSDGTLTGNRELDGDGNNLTFTAVNKFEFSGDSLYYFLDPAGNLRLKLGNQQFTMQGDTASLSRRISYTGNLGSSFTKHSLVDRNYVDSSITASPSGTVTSVGLSMPTAFAVANSPVTSSGTITVTGAGVASQYIRGDGQLATLPTTGGGGSSVSYYLNGSVNQGTFGGTPYYEMSKTAIFGAGTDFNISSNGYIASFITDAGDPALLNIPAGNWDFEVYFQSSSASGTPSFYVELYKYDGTTFTLIASSATNPKFITGGTAVDAYYTPLAVPSTSLTITDRLAVRIYVNNSGNTITLHTEDNNLCQIITTFSTGINALNGLTSQVQYFATGTSGTDFNINSLTDTHTFNLPTASATNRGALSSADWSTFNSKIGPSDTASMLSNYVTNAGYGLLKTTKTLSVDTLLISTRAWRQKGIDSVTSLINARPSGSGTTNYVSKWTGSSALGNSQIFDNGTNVGIITTSPTNLLTLVGSLTGRGIDFVTQANFASVMGRINYETTNDLFSIINTSSWGNSALIFGTSNTERMRISQGGNVGIGTTSINSSLEIYKASGTNYIYLTNGTSGTNNGVVLRFNNIDYMGMIGTFTTGELKVGGFNASGYFMTFYSNNSERMRLTPSGRLLLGTTTESTYILDANGTVRVQGTELRLDNATTGTLNIYSNTPSIQFFSADPTGYRFYRSGTGMIWNSSGSISTQIAGNDAYTLNASSGHIWRTALSGGAALARLTTGGNLIVGGTTDAGYRADIQGTSRFTGTALFTGNIGGNNWNFDSGNVRWVFGSATNQSSRFFTLINIWSTTAATLAVRNIASQTANSLQIENSSSTVLSGFDVNGGLFVGSTSLNASAIIEATSTTKGFLPPRMTNAQMVAIATPAAGLVVYDTTNNKLNVYDGTNWVTLH